MVLFDKSAVGGSRGGGCKRKIGEDMGGSLCVNGIECRSIATGKLGNGGSVPGKDWGLIPAEWD